MFKLAQSPEFWVPVEFEWTSEKGNREVVKFRARCKRFTLDEITDLQKRIRDEQLMDDVVAREVVVGWDGIEDDDGKPAEFDSQSFGRFLQLGTAGAIVLAYFRAYPRAREKN